MNTLESYFADPEAFEAETRRMERMAATLQVVIEAIFAKRLRTATDKLESIVDRLDPTIGQDGAQ